MKPEKPITERLTKLTVGGSHATKELAAMVGLNSPTGLKVMICRPKEGIVVFLVTLEQGKGRGDTRRKYTATWQDGVLCLNARFTPNRQKQLIDATDRIFLFTRVLKPQPFTFQGEVVKVDGPTRPQQVATFHFRRKGTAKNDSDCHQERA